LRNKLHFCSDRESGCRFFKENFEGKEKGIRKNVGKKKKEIGGLGREVAKPSESLERRSFHLPDILTSGPPSLPSGPIEERSGKGGGAKKGDELQLRTSPFKEPFEVVNACMKKFGGRGDKKRSRVSGNMLFIP